MLAIAPLKGTTANFLIFLIFLKIRSAILECVCKRESRRRVNKPFRKRVRWLHRPARQTRALGKPLSQPILKSLRIAVYDQPALSRINGRYVFLNKSTRSETVFFFFFFSAGIIKRRRERARTIPRNSFGSKFRRTVYRRRLQHRLQDARAR